MYDQCDVVGNECLLLDLQVDYWKDDRIISLTDQQTRVWGGSVTCKSIAGWKTCCQWKDVLPPANSCLLCKSPIQYRQLSLLLHRGLIMSLLLHIHLLMIACIAIHMLIIMEHVSNHLVTRCPVIWLSGLWLLNPYIPMHHACKRSLSHQTLILRKVIDSFH